MLSESTFDIHLAYNTTHGIPIKQETTKKDSTVSSARSAPSLGDCALHVPIPGRPVRFFDSIDDNPVNTARETLDGMASSVPGNWRVKRR